jgi:hypothetical protein
MGKGGEQCKNYRSMFVQMRNGHEIWDGEFHRDISPELMGKVKLSGGAVI